MADEVLKILLDDQDNFVSGEYIAKKLGITRQAVSKRVAYLKGKGFVITSRTNKGYQLLSFPDIIVPEFIERETGFMPVYSFDVIGSTNTYAKKLALDGAPELTSVVSEVQDAGRGRMDREWLSPPGGLWFSFILRPRCQPSHASVLNFVAANAVAKALDSVYGIKVQMKWPNDVYYGEKKLCGVSILVSSDTDLIHYVVVGVGINVNNDMPEDINATSIKNILSRTVDRNQFLVALLNTSKAEYTLFEQKDFKNIMDYSRSISNTIGKFVRISFLGSEKVGKVVDINDDGAIILEFDEKREEILVGDVQFLRPL